MRSTSPGPGSRGSPEHRGQHRPAGSARLAGRSPRFPGWGRGRGGVEEALGGSCRGGFESLLSSAIGLPLAVRASRRQRGAEGRAPCWASVPAPGTWLSVTQQLPTRPRAPYCVITATWHGFGPREPPTPTVRSRPPGSGWGGRPAAPAALLCEVAAPLQALGLESAGSKMLAPRGATAMLRRAQPVSRAIRRRLGPAGEKRRGGGGFRV